MQQLTQELGICAGIPLEALRLASLQIPQDCRGPMSTGGFPVAQCLLALTHFEIEPQAEPVRGR